MFTTTLVDSDQGGGRLVSGGRVDIIIHLFIALATAQYAEVINPAASTLPLSDVERLATAETMCLRDDALIPTSHPVREWIMIQRRDPRFLPPSRRLADHFRRELAAIDDNRNSFASNSLRVFCDTMNGPWAEQMASLFNKQEQKRNIFEMDYCQPRLDTMDGLHTVTNPRNTVIGLTTRAETLRACMYVLQTYLGVPISFPRGTGLLEVRQNDDGTLLFSANGVRLPPQCSSLARGNSAVISRHVACALRQEHMFTVSGTGQITVADPYVSPERAEVMVNQRKGALPTLITPVGLGTGIGK